MLLVDAKVGKSQLHGLGLFAMKPISKGTPMWKWQEGVDIRISPAVVSQLPAAARSQLDNYCWIEDGDYMLCMDDARFMNHHNEPNTVERDRQFVAAKDIAAGEELTCDYYAFDEAAGIKLKEIR